MRFNLLIENALKKTDLIRVRLKMDPRIKEHSKFTHVHGYEGYILEELDGHVKMFVVNRDMGDDPIDLINSLINVPKDMATPCDCQKEDNTPLSKLKKFILNNIEDELTDTETEQINNTTDIQQLEMLLKQANVDDAALETMYKTYLNNEQ